MPALTPGLATHQPVKGECGSGNGAMLLKRLQAVGRAGRLKSASTAKPGTEQQAVSLDQAQQDISRQTPDNSLNAAHAATVCGWRYVVAACINASNSVCTAFFNATEEALGKSLRANSRLNLTR